MIPETVQALTAQLARDPASLVFLPLAEALRRKGQLDAALTVAQTGAARYPEMASAYDLIARIRSDRGEGDLAFDAWTTVLRLDPDHPGALKGLGFLCYRAGDLPRSLRYLSRAAELVPGDPALSQAVRRVREAAAPVLAAAAPDPLRAMDAEPDHSLLVDRDGRLLAGELIGARGEPAGEAVAAALTGVTREAERAARLLGLGPWQRISLEGGPAHFELRAPTPDTALLLTRPRSIPAGRLAMLADRAAAAARRWLEELR